MSDSFLRRDFLHTAIGAGLALQACSTPAATATCPPARVVPEPAPGRPLVLTGLPFRQDDPAWGSDLMWDRALVIRAAHELNGESLATARSLLREFDDGNTLANEGCQLTCFAMILRLLAPEAEPAWTPRRLNEAAQAAWYYSPCGLSMTTLYADLVAEMTGGDVQLCLKEEYLPGEPGWPRVFPNTSALVRAYRRLSPAVRSRYLVMLKTGTWDDTVASHYVLLHPNDAGGPDDPNPDLLDPAQPLDAGEAPWKLTHSAAAITEDPDIAEGWRAAAIEPTQIGGVWVFARWEEGRARSSIAPLVSAWAAELAT